jgi:hypothetical protein
MICLARFGPALALSEHAEQRAADSFAMTMEMFPFYFGSCWSALPCRPLSSYIAIWSQH